MIELNVSQTMLTVEAAAAAGISLSVGQAIPSVDIIAGIQGPEGVPGSIGPAGRNLEYGDLTEADKMDLVHVFDMTSGQTSYANVFLNTLLA